MNYQETLDYLSHAKRLGSRPGLERIHRLCSLLDNPQDSVPTIHVTGTNGKGSFCAISESILRAAGYRTGLFVSPYLKRYNECINVNGKEITDPDFAEVMTHVRTLADTTADPPTEFELLTAAAFEYFRRNECDVAIIEVGMGGSLDSTNVITSPSLSVITGVSIDHTAQLGKTLEEIAEVKAGIIKPGCPILWCGENSTAQKVISERAKALGCTFLVPDYSKLSKLHYSLDGCDFNFDDFENLHISLNGIKQPQNAASAITAVRSAGFEISRDALYKGLSTVYLPGRLETLSHCPIIIYDGAHNKEAAALSVESIKAMLAEKSVNLLSGIMRDKDYLAVAAEFSQICERVFVVKPDTGRALPAEEYSEVFHSLGIPASTYPTIYDGVAAAYSESLKTGVPLLIAGSFYMYVDVRDALENIFRC